VHGASAANRTPDFRPAERLIDDLSDGTGAAAALGAAAETAIDMASGPARRRGGSGTYLLVAQYVAGADDHWKPSFRTQTEDAAFANG